MNLWEYLKANRDNLLNVNDLVSELNKLDKTLPVVIQIDDMGPTPIRRIDTKLMDGVAVILSSD